MDNSAVCERGTTGRLHSQIFLIAGSGGNVQLFFQPDFRQPLTLIDLLVTANMAPHQVKSRSLETTNCFRRHVASVV